MSGDDTIKKDTKHDGGPDVSVTDDVSLTDGYWKRYLDSLTRSMTERITKIAESGEYMFEYVDGPKKGSTEILKRGKISVKQMQELEKMRAKFGRMNKESAGAEEAQELLASIYAKCAKYYFNMEKDDFYNTDWDTSKPNIDAAAHISTYGRPK